MTFRERVAEMIVKLQAGAKAAAAKGRAADALQNKEVAMVQLDVGDEGRVVIVPEDAYTLMLMVPVAKLPATVDQGTLLWLMRRNFHDSPLAPFRIGCDHAGSLVVWGRMPMDGLTGEHLVGLLDAVADEATLIREEIAIDEGADDEAEAAVK